MSKSMGLSEEFHKVRRMFGFFSAVAVGWGVIGATLEKAQKVPLTDSAIQILHPERAPVVLAALIVYFGLRLMIEWFQQPAQVRKMAPSRLDLFLAYSIAAVALAISAYRIPTEATFNTTNFFALAGGMGVGWILIRLLKSTPMQPSENALMAIAAMSAIAMIALAVLFPVPVVAVAAGLGVVGGIWANTVYTIHKAARESAV